MTSIFFCFSILKKIVKLKKDSGVVKFRLNVNKLLRIPSTQKEFFHFDEGFFLFFQFFCFSLGILQGFDILEQHFDQAWDSQRVSQQCQNFLSNHHWSCRWNGFRPRFHFYLQKWSKGQRMDGGWMLRGLSWTQGQENCQGLELSWWTICSSSIGSK